MSRKVLPDRWSESSEIEPKTVLSSRVNLVKLAVILASVAGFLAIYHWVTRGYSSGFVFARLGFLEANIQTGDPLLERYGSFPFAAGFLAVIRTTLGTTSLHTAFLPIIPLVAVLFVYPFARLLFSNKLVAVGAILPAYLSVFAQSPHFAEYLFGQLFFLLFVFATVLFLNGDKRYKRRFGMLAIAFYLGVKFFAPPMEMWAVAWILSLLALTTVRYCSEQSLLGVDRVVDPEVGQTPISRTTVKRLFQLSVLVVVLLLAYNPKLYDQFLVEFQVRGSNLISAAETLFVKLVGGSAETTSEFAVPSESPRPLQLANILKYGIIGVVTVGVASSRLLRQGPSFVYQHFRQMIAVTLLAAYSSELLVYAAVGAGIQLRYVVLVFSVVAVFYAATVKPRAVLVAVTAGLVLTSAFGVVYDVSHQPARDVSETEPTAELVGWKQTYSTSDRVTTDHHTLGVLMAMSGTEYQEPQIIDMVQLDTEMYTSFNNSSSRDRYEFDYLLLNRDTLDEPAMKGPPSWGTFEPLGEHLSAVNRERRLQKVYVSDSYMVYKSTG